MSEEILSVDQFLNGITTKDGQPLKSPERDNILSELENALYTSAELSKIHFNTQVYNKIENGVTTRGEHSEGVARVAAKLASISARKKGLSELSIKNSALLALCFGYMHDMGHTPFGHDGEGALGEEMERFKTSNAYFDSRKKQLGSTYTRNTDYDSNNKPVEKMCYEHNETSAIIGSNFLTEFLSKKDLKISDQSMNYVKTAILAHSTSRVKKEPNGAEQQAVRLADKVAYIPQDLGDLLKQGIIDKDILTNEELTLIGLNSVELQSYDYEQIKKSNFKGLSKEEIEIVESLDDKSPDSIKTIIEMINEERVSLLDKVKNIGTGKLNEAQEYAINEQLNSHIYSTQEAIAEQLFDADGNMKGQKEEFDDLAKFAKKCLKDKDGNYYYEKNGEVISTIDKKHKNNTAKLNEGVELLGNLNTAIKNYDDVKLKRQTSLTEEEAKNALNNATKNLKSFLEQKYGMNPVVATLWITKHKYQDSFIANKLHVIGNREKRTGAVQQNQSLAEVNQRNDNGWKMKTTFQYFFSNQDQIPKEFRNKYPEDQFTPQQLVSAYIASFTNDGLETLYKGLVSKNAIVSRDQVIEHLLKDRTSVDFSEKMIVTRKKLEAKANGHKITDKDVFESILSNIQKSIEDTKGESTSINDILETIYEANGATIVGGKKYIPKTQFSDKILTSIRYKKSDLKNSAIKLSIDKVNSAEIKKIIEAASQKNQDQIEEHLKDASKKQSIGQSQYGEQ